ncbi:MAG: CBS domain-containing protein [Prevotellaceae bacterium]|nr:CBS domain-containing protein [Prevotellaceae bacterium]
MNIILFAIAGLYVNYLIRFLLRSADSLYIIATSTGAFLFLILLILLFKRLGAKKSQRFISVFYPVIKATYFLFAPIVRIVFPKNSLPATDSTDDDTDTNENTYAFDAPHNIANIEVKEILLSRMDIVAIDISIDFNTLYDTIVESGYSRFPVYENDIDHIKGILYLKDILPYVKSEDDFQWQDLIHEAYFVLEHNKISTLLDEMKQRKIHIAVVVDEYGITVGIVTLEDILEEIVGEIFDESDVESEETFYIKSKDGSYSFEGKTPLVDFCRIMQIDHELLDVAKGDSETLAGLLLEHKGELLHKGEELNFAGFTFKVESVGDRRIIRIKVTKNE